MARPPSVHPVDVVDVLRQHHTYGRLDAEEFNDRMSTALTAKTATELDQLFDDLPGPSPSGAESSTTTFTPPPWQSAPAADLPPRDDASAVGPTWGGQPGRNPTELTPTGSSAVPGKQSPNRALLVAGGLLWPAALIFCFATDWQFWWVILIPVFFTGWLKNSGSRS